MDIFSEQNNCMYCEKVVDSGSPFCSDACRLADSAPKPSHTTSPFLLANVPGLLASHTTRGGHTTSSPRLRTNQPSATSSQSEDSSPLSSPSPFAHSALGGSSPEKGDFALPPSVFGAHQATFPMIPNSMPVQIPSNHRTGPSSHRGSVGGESTIGPDHTLHYGRRPAQTNSVTSPMALNPIGGPAFGTGRRRESNDKLVRPHPMSPSVRPKVASDSAVGTAGMGLGTRRTSNAGMVDNTRKYFNYGMHSPLIGPTARRVSAAAAAAVVDTQPVHASSLSHSRQLAGMSSMTPVQHSPVLDKSTRSSGASTIVGGLGGAGDYFERRKSFPVQPKVGPMSPLLTPSTNESGPTSPLMVDEEEEEGRGRGRGRGRDQRDTSVARREQSREAANRSATSSRSSRGGSSQSTSSRVAVSPTKSRRIAAPLRRESEGSNDRLSRGREVRKGEDAAGRVPSRSESRGHISVAVRPTPSRVTAIPTVDDNARPIPTNLSPIAASYQRASQVQQRDFGAFQKPVLDAGARPGPRAGNGGGTSTNGYNSQNSSARSSRTGSPTKTGGRTSTADARANKRLAEEDSKAQKELKRLFDEGVTAR